MGQQEMVEIILFQEMLFGTAMTMQSRQQAMQKSIIILFLAHNTMVSILATIKILSLAISRSSIIL